MVWVPEHTRSPMRNYDFEFAVSTEDRLYSRLSPEEQACVLERCKALRYWQVLCVRPGESSPEDSWHFLQTIAKGLFDYDGGDEPELELYHGPVTFPGRWTHYYFRGDDYFGSPWPTESVVYAIFETRRQTDYVIIVRNRLRVDTMITANLDTFREASEAILEPVEEPVVVLSGDFVSDLRPIIGDGHMRGFPLADAMISLDLDPGTSVRLSVESVALIPVPCAGVQWREGPYKAALFLRRAL